MRIIRAKDYQDMSRKAAYIIAAKIINNPKAVLGLATGSTPEGAYAQLVEWYKNGDLDFSQVQTVNLDEYKDLPREDKNSYYYFMCHNLFDHVNIDKNNVHLPDGMEKDSKKACADYNAQIDAVGGADIQLLGIGGNGHIGFNEPSDVFKAGTHCVTLTERTIQDNARFFNSIDEVPKFAYTMGIKNIMQAKTVLLVASGKNKADAIKKTICGPITPQVPASILQLHNDAIIVADEDALSAL